MGLILLNSEIVEFSTLIPIYILSLLCVWGGGVKKWKMSTVLDSHMDGNLWSSKPFTQFLRECGFQMVSLIMILLKYVLPVWETKVKSPMMPFDKSYMG